jgi:hypothetical protein
MGAAFTADRARRSAICRISEGRSRWRVLVETWPDRDAYRGRLLFCADAPDAAVGAREGPALLLGRSHEDVLSLAHDLPEERLRRVLNSLG